jgi:hypothetical protein
VARNEGLTNNWLWVLIGTLATVPSEKTVGGGMWIGRRAR